MSGYFVRDQLCGLKGARQPLPAYTIPGRLGVMGYPQLSKELSAQLKQVDTTFDGVCEYAPCQVTLRCGASAIAYMSLRRAGTDAPGEWTHRKIQASKL
jgi:hypothetical protein